MFNDMFEYVKKCLRENDTEATKIDCYPFRKRSEHIWRVFQWAKRLIDEGGPEIAADRESVLAAALFHDSGYALSLDGSEHAGNSAIVYQKYVAERNMTGGRHDFIEYLIRNHSNKALLSDDNSPPELVILMEADLLDETGAMSIVWDCMAEGGQSEQSFEKTYMRIKSASRGILGANPMKTAKAKEYWTKKQNLLRDFLDNLKTDIGIAE